MQENPDSRPYYEPSDGGTNSAQSAFLATPAIQEAQANTQTLATYSQKDRFPQ